jgi:hypothetical protein
LICKKQRQGYKANEGGIQNNAFRRPMLLTTPPQDLAAEKLAQEKAARGKHRENDAIYAFAPPRRRLTESLSVAPSDLDLVAEVEKFSAQRHVEEAEDYRH